MFDISQTKINTSHTNNMVPFIYVSKEKLSIVKNCRQLKDVSQIIMHLLKAKADAYTKDSSLIK